MKRRSIITSRFLNTFQILSELSNAKSTAGDANVITMILWSQARYATVNQPAEYNNYFDIVALYFYFSTFWNFHIFNSLHLYL